MATVEVLMLARGELSIELRLAPFSFALRRRGRRLLRAGGAWVADGVVDDRFILFTEGVVAREQLAPVERTLQARVDEAGAVRRAAAAGAARRSEGAA